MSKNDESLARVEEIIRLALALKGGRPEDHYVADRTSQILTQAILIADTMTREDAAHGPEEEK